MRAIELAGRLIVLEGIDSSGKSTQARLLAERLAAAGYPVVTTREPGGTTIAESVRRLLLEREHHAMLPLSELLLFMVSRAQNTHEVIRPALEAGKVVVASRYRLSSVAYQGFGRGLDLDLVHTLNDAVTGGLLPDVTFLIDLPAEVAVARKEENDRIEGESIEFHRRVRGAFLDLVGADPAGRIIDGTKSVEAIADEVAKHLGI